MLQGLALLLAYQLIGEAVAHFGRLPIPGTVVGMILLLLSLYSRVLKESHVSEACDAIIKHIGLLFVPAGVGIIAHTDLIAKEWKVIVFASFVSTIITLLCSASIFLALRGEK